MNFTFESEGTYTYLVYSIGREDSLDTMSLGMLTNNKIPGIAPTLYTQMDEAKYIKYNVSAKISVKQFFSGPVNRKRLLGVFSGIVNGLISAEDYMIDLNSIILDLDYIFVDVSTCNTVLICLPIANVVEQYSDLGMFFKNIMFNIQSDQTENCNHVAEIINYLNSSPVFSLVDFKRVLDGLQNGSGVVVPSPEIVPTRPETPPASLKVVERPPQNVPQTPPQQPPKPVVPTPVAPPKENIPPMVPPSVIPKAPQEKGISMFTLLMHYSKENAAAYKAQKAAKKAAQTPIQAGNVGFSVPGAPNPPANNLGFAIPGQATPAPTPGAQQPFKPYASPQPAQHPSSQSAPQPAPQPASQHGFTPQGTSMNFGDTTVLSGGSAGETTVLTGGKTAQGRPLSPFLIRSKNNEKIPVNKPVYRIGKERSYVDYFVGDNTAVSRSHANIITRDGMYFIMDTNSTNHTYVNGAMIQSNVEVRLSSGDKFRLANEDFEFILE